MTEEEANDLLEKLIDEFGDKLPNPIHYPNSFMYYVKWYKYLELNRQ